MVPAATVALLEERGLARESEGALVVPLEDEGMPVCIVRKSDGGFNYATTDIATVRSREAELWAITTPPAFPRPSPPPPARASPRPGPARL